MKLVIVAILALFIVSCAQQAPQNAPVAPIKPAGEDAEVITPATEEIFGEVNETEVLDVDGVLCDKATRTLTFRFRNTDNVTWQMNQEVGWNAPRSIAPVQVLINNYEANGRNQYIVNGEKYFGPKWPFSENCGGVTELQPGEDVTCTVSPVSLKSATAVAAGKNEISISTKTSHHIIQFMCE